MSRDGFVAVLDDGGLVDSRQAGRIRRSSITARLIRVPSRVQQPITA